MRAIRDHINLNFDMTRQFCCEIAAKKCTEVRQFDYRERWLQSSTILDSGCIKLGESASRLSAEAPKVAANLNARAGVALLARRASDSVKFHFQTRRAVQALSGDQRDYEPSNLRELSSKLRAFHLC